MIFTTVKKRVEKEELFPNDAVMTLVDNKFSLNKKAMELFGFPLNIANTSRIANGYDENNNVILATIDTNDMYTNNITAKNDFSSQLLSTRLAKQFKLIDGENHFNLNLIEESIGVKYVGVQLINAINAPEQQFEEVEPGFYEHNVAIFADDITENLIKEYLPEPPAEILLEVQENYVVEQLEIEEEVKPEPIVEIPQTVISKVINTDSW